MNSPSPDSTSPLRGLPALEEALCKVPLNILTLRRIFLGLVRCHYSDADNYGYLQQHLDRMTYNPTDPGRSSLHVALTEIRPTNTNVSPGVFVQVGGTQYKGSVLSDQIRLNADASGQYGVYTATNVITLWHLSADADTSYALATSSTDFLISCRELLFSKFPEFLSFRVDTTGEADRTPRPKTEDEHLIVPVRATFNYRYTWETVTETHRIKDIDLRIFTELSTN